MCVCVEKAVFTFLSLCFREKALEWVVIVLVEAVCVSLIAVDRVGNVMEQRKECMF